MDLIEAMVNLRLIDDYWAMVRDPDPKVHNLKILISYTWFNGQRDILLRLYREGKITLAMLDAGTYGMNPDGENPGIIDLFEKFKHVVRREGINFDRIANFDDRFNEPGHNNLNYAEMRREFSHLIDASGRSVADKLVPVTHNRDIAADEFFGYAEDGATLIGVGSKPMITREQWQLIDEIREDMGVRAHRFGNQGFRDLVNYRINSSDSSRYARAGMYGKEMWFWDDDLKKPVNIDLRSCEVTSRHKSFLMDTFGLTVVDIIAKVQLLWVVNMYCTQKVQEYLTDELGIV